MRRRYFQRAGFAVLMTALVACGSAPAPQAAPTSAPVAAPANAVTAAKPVFMDFYAVW